ncbi:uncharacterized protein LOC132731586 [Ruditapes philippinarum]|uniref:uncharacterized protein LOC132731586 n=1 Tax=Ruditapes philippinarum TaxID=129788 RepID=UPI00295AC696|nr:uncharacterized protein LOC132731586 [Ruditapes philippinarum]
MEQLLHFNLLCRICNWEDTNECPRIERRWNIVADAAAVKISERISRELDNWLRQNNILRVLDNEIIEVFKTELGLIDSQVKELEEYFVRSRGGNMCKVMCKVPVKALFPRKKTKVEKTYSTLGCAVSCLGMLDTYMRNARRIFRDFNHTTKARKMSEAAVLSIETILSHKEFGGKLRKFFDRYFKEIDEAAKGISEFVKVSRENC